jgi:energy-coupling factor transport system permease protein
MVVVATGWLAILLDRPAALCALVVCSGVWLFASPIGWAWRGRAVALAALVVWTNVVGQGLFYSDLPRQALWEMGPLALYREGLVHGALQSTRMLSVTFAGLAVAVTTSPDRLFAALVRLRVPYGAAFMAVTGLRFVPLVAEEWATVRAARAERGCGRHRRNPVAWMRAEIELIRPLLIRSIRRSRTLAETLDARGFDPVVPRRVRRPLTFGVADYTTLAAAFTLVGGIGLAEAITWLYLADVYYEPALRPVYAVVRAWF